MWIDRLTVGSEAFTPEETAAQNYLRDALQRANDAVDQWNESHRDALFTARIESSDALMKVHAELSRTCRDLAEIGFEVFKTRIAALQLGDWKARSLYAGSADFARYQAPANPPSLGDLKSLWHLDGGKDQRLFVDQNPHALASNFNSWTARNAELAKLLKQAKAELAKAQAIAA